MHLHLTLQSTETFATCKCRARAHLNLSYARTALAYAPLVFFSNSVKSEFYIRNFQIILRDNSHTAFLIIYIWFYKLIETQIQTNTKQSSKH